MLFKLFNNLQLSHVLIIFFFIGISALGFAYYMEHFHNLPPCVLCVYQRWVYFFVIFLSIILLILHQYSERKARTIMLVFSLTFLVGSILAMYHVGVENSWWTGTESCAADSEINSGDLDALRKNLSEKSITRCDEVLWSFFGISMAGYNFIISFILFIFSMGYFRNTRNES